MNAITKDAIKYKHKIYLYTRICLFIIIFFFMDCA